VAEQDVRQLGTAGARVLRLTTECYTCYHWLPPILTPYRRLFPGVEVRIDVEATSRPVPALLEGQIDVAVIRGPGPLDRRLTARRILDDALVLIAAPAHRLGRSRAPVAPSELEGETLFIYPPRHESGVLRRILMPAGVVPRVEEVKLTEAIVELVKAGLGVAALAEWAVRPYLIGGALVARPIVSPEARRRWCAVMLRTTARVDYVKAFVDLVARQAPSAARAIAVPPPPRLIRRATHRARAAGA
jgi:LysR family transcriptional regulator for metE and metH